MKNTTIFTEGLHCRSGCAILLAVTIRRPMSLLPTPVKRVNYLNNKDILKEIHSSKTTYCHFTKPEYNRYDFIVDMPHSALPESFEYAFKPESIQQARETRAAFLDVDAGAAKGTTDPLTIPIVDLVFRVMTWDHVPVAPKQPRKTVKKKTAKDIFEFEEVDPNALFVDLEDPATKDEVDDMVHVKVNFPPFQHYKIDANNSFFCVGKSHWEGDMETGVFNKDHGQVTNKLAKMYIMMCEKYAMKYNWRGYTYRDEMQNSAILQLTYVGLRFNEAKSANPFAFYTAVITNSFCRVLNTEKRNQNIRDDILEIAGLNPSWSRQSNSTTHYEE